VTSPLADTPHGLACTAARSMDDALGSYVPARAGSPTPRHPRCWEISGARFTRTRRACSRGPVTAFLDVAFRVSVPLAAWPNPNRGYCSSRGAVSRTRPRQRTRCFTLAGWITSDQRAVSPLNQLHTDNSTVDAHHLRGSFCFLFFWPKKVLQYLFALPNIQMTSHKFTRLS
jgi:hypothetical protein